MLATALRRIAPRAAAGCHALRCPMLHTARAALVTAGPDMASRSSMLAIRPVPTCANRPQRKEGRCLHVGRLAAAEPNATTSTEDMVYSDNTKLVSEFTVQMLFNFLSCTAVATSQSMSAGNGLHATLMLMGAHAVILPMLIFVFGSVSGAHFNPMVTAAMVTAGQLPARLGLGYVAAQLAGAVVGSAAAFWSLPSKLQTAAMAGIQAVPPDHTVAQAFLAEAFGSFFFIAVVFGCLTDKRGWGKLAPFAVPLAITLLMWLIGPISSMCVNPARAFGPAVVTGMWEHHWVWWTAPFLGGCSAAALYGRLFLPVSQRPKAFK